MPEGRSVVPGVALLGEDGSFNIRRELRLSKPGKSIVAK